MQVDGSLASSAGGEPAGRSRTAWNVEIRGAPTAPQYWPLVNCWTWTPLSSVVVDEYLPQL